MPIKPGTVPSKPVPIQHRMQVVVVRVVVRPVRLLRVSISEGLTQANSQF